MDDFRILLLNTKLGNLNAYLTTYVHEGLEKVLGPGTVVVSDYHHCLRDCGRHRCNTVLCLDGQELHELMVSKLRRLSTRMVLWLTEDPYEQSRNLPNLQYFDLVFTNDCRSARYYDSNKVFHLPFAASPTYHRHDVIEKESDYLYDVFFAGTAWPNRVRLLGRIISQLSEYRCKLIVPYNEFLEKPDLGLCEFEMDYRLCNKDLALIQNRSKIVLYLHRDFSASNEIQKSSTPGPRVFETALSGAFQLAEDNLPELDKYFTRDREIAYFGSADGCVSRIRHFLRHSEARQRIARAAQQRAEREHLYEHRAHVLLDRLRAVAPVPRRARSNGRRVNVLFVLHNVAGKPPYGGSELHTRSTMASLPPRFRSLVYYPDMAVPGARKMVLECDGVEKSSALPQPFDADRFFDIEREHVFARILERERIDLVHFMHFLHHPFSLLEVAQRHGAATVVTLHDYFVLCPRFNLLDANGRFCWNNRPPLASCDIDLRRIHNMLPGSQAARRAAVAQMLTLADAVTCVSSSQWEIVRSVYSHIEEKVRIISPGIVPEEFAGHRRAPRDSGKPMAIAAIGNFTAPKGADSLIYVFNHFRDDPRVRFIIVGRVDHPYTDIIKHVGLQDVRIVGDYRPGELPEILRGVDVGLLVSIWAETYVLTLSECWAAGVVPIVADVGALRERVTDGVNALKVPPDSPGHIAEAMERLLSEKGLLEHLRAGLHTGPVQTVRAASEAYVKLYTDLLEREDPAPLHADGQRSRGDFTRIPCFSRRLHPGWARYAGNEGSTTDAVSGGAGPSLVRRAVAYYQSEGVFRTTKRAFRRMMGYS